MTHETTATSQPGLHLNAVGKDYGGRTVVDNLSFSVLPGAITALRGENGSGKTTVLRCILGLTIPTRGSVTYHGTVLASGPDAPIPALPDAARRAARTIASVTDDHAFLPGLTAAEHLDLLARAHGNPDPAATIADALSTLRIDHVADLHPYSLSSGQRRRLLLASLVVRPADCLILDEPEQRLDDVGLSWLAAFLRDTAATGTAILMASHDATLLAATHADIVPVACHDA